VEQSNFYDYQVLRMNRIPQIHVEVIRTDNPPTGVGQMAAPLGAPAVGNAIARLTGMRLRHPPFTGGPGKKRNWLIFRVDCQRM
jgi:isoquinoline 1-oxidoreductase beta subunit